MLRISLNYYPLQNFEPMDLKYKGKKSTKNILKNLRLHIDSSGTPGTIYTNTLLSLFKIWTRSWRGLKCLNFEPPLWIQHPAKFSGQKSCERGWGRRYNFINLSRNQRELVWIWGCSLSRKVTTLPNLVDICLLQMEIQSI